MSEPNPVHDVDLASRFPDASRPISGRCPLCNQPPPKRSKRRREPTTDEDYRQSLWRQIAKYGDRIRAGGVEVLADAVALRDALDNVINAGVADCRSTRWVASWAEIGRATNMSRQAAQERWASLGGARHPGGQPSSLR
jgi:hypothetical protein